MLEIYLSEELKAMTDDEIKATVDESFSFMYSAYLTQFFDPETSMDNGNYNYIIPRWIQGSLIYSGTE